MTSTTLFELQSPDQADEVVAGLERRFQVRRRSPVDEESTYLDTFDWRLDRAGAALRWTASEERSDLHWIPRNGGRSVRARTSRVPPFASELPEGDLRDTVGPVVEGRRLLPVVRLASRTQQLDLVDEEEKTVARLYLDERRVRLPEANGTGDWTELGPAVRIERIRGYDEPYQRLQRYVEYELGLPRRSVSEVRELLARFGRVPGGDPSKIDVELDPEMPADEAMRGIYRALLEAMVANRAGALAQLDTEFVHDLRVACRRTRSLLSQVDSVLPSSVTGHYAQEFRWIGSITGPVRDLDVLFEELDGYREHLSEAQRDDLAPLVSRLFNRHRAASATMKSGLESPRLATLVANWREYLDAPPARQAAPRDATAPIAVIAADRIERAHRKLCRLGRKITDESPDDEVHSVRIRGKKLRYLLETFRGLYPRKKVSATVRALKGLQDGLGEFNDLCVHSELLQSVALELGGKDAGKTLLATGHLCARLEDRAREIRSHVTERFAAFDTKKNRKALRKMLAEA